jgi:5'-methylthioadenosine phosphorylase
MFVLVDQFEDRTFARQTSFFGTGCVAHAPMAHPTSPLLRARIAAAAAAEGIACRSGGTYLCMEGPQFSTLAESLSYKARGLDVIGMTAATEAKLAREAELPYAAVAMVTDYDCWHEEHGPVDVASVLRIVRLNAERVEALLRRVLTDFPAEHEACPGGADRALDGAIMTAPEARDPELMKKLEAIVARALAKG